jgi:TonB family protein
MATILEPYTRPRPAAGLAAVVSGVVHVLLIGLLLRSPGSPRLPDFSTVLPALYLYAPDRQPTEPREFRVPFPEELGQASGADVPVAHPLPDGVVRSPPVPRKGLLPPGPPALRIDSVFSAIAVDSEVERYPSAAPIYPDALLEEGLEGEVEAEFVVDTTGIVDLESVRILSSTHDEFTASVREALVGARFRPAWRDRRKVRQLVRQRFTFRIFHWPESDSESVSM